jgi:ferrous iron transport protein B
MPLKSRSEAGSGVHLSVLLDRNGAETRAENDGLPRVAIVGLPNTGKSLLFQRLTGRFGTSANYPYTTSQLDQAPARLGRHRVLLMDTPGISGIELSSEDEAPTRELLRDDPPDVLILCVDAGSPARSLVLAAQLADLAIPSVVCLNMVDEALGKGLIVDHQALERELGVPVLPACALDGRGIAGLAGGLARARVPRQVAYPDRLQAKLDALPPALPRAHRVERVLRLEAPDDLEPCQSVRHMVLEAHQHWAREVTARVVRTSGLEPKLSVWGRIEDLALHPLGAWVFLALTMTAVYLLVAKVGVALLSNGMERLLARPALAAIASAFGPGVARDVLVGDFGLLSLGLSNALCTVLPILGVFYLVYGFLEDIGYFPLLSVQFDRLLRLIGLTGRAVLPITLGFGCNAVASMSTRCLPTRRQRFIACFIIALGIPCAAQLGVTMAILAAVPPVLMGTLVLVAVVILIIAGSTLARVLPGCERGEFLIELPPLRPPRWGNIVNKTYHRLREFCLEAVPLFMASAALLLVLHLTGLLGRIRELLAPVVVDGLGLPEACADMLLMALARREVGAVMMKEMVDAGQLSLQQIFVGLLVMTLFVPCMSNTMILGRTLGWLRTLVIVAAVTVIALCAGMAANAVWP